MLQKLQVKQASIAFFNLKKKVGHFHEFPKQIKGTMEAQGATNISYVNPLLPPPHPYILSIFLKPIFHASTRCILKAPISPHRKWFLMYKVPSL
jgi:hypothetical protein